MIPRVILLLLGSLLLAHSAQSLSYPLKVAYLDQIDCCAPQNTILAAVNAGFNVIVLAFYQTDLGTADAALGWSQRMDNETRIQTMQTIHDAGAVLTVSLGGANDQRWESADATQLATTIANFANEYVLDGVDFDLEHFGGFDAIDGDDAATVAWFSTLITVTRSILGPNGIISLAPLPPWFGPIGLQACETQGQLDCSWVGQSGGMTAVYQQVGSEIDYFFVQFYNQGACYTTEAGLFMESGPGCTTPGVYYPYTSVKEIAAGGIPMSKIVIGKPVDNGNSAASGYVDPALLSAWIESSGKSLGWNTGVGIWEWLDIYGGEAIPWLNAVYPSASSPPSATAAPTHAPTSAPTNHAATAAPSHAPTAAPSHAPATNAPTQAPTQAPTVASATPAPSGSGHKHHATPAPAATASPTARPAATSAPTEAPTAAPSAPSGSSPSGSAPSGSTCTTGQMKCTGDSTFSTCAYGVWQADQSCQVGLLCQAVEPYIYCM